MNELIGLVALGWVIYLVARPFRVYDVQGWALIQVLKNQKWKPRYDDRVHKDR